MRIKKTTLGPAKVKLEIVATDAEIQSIKQHVVGHLAAASKVAGFRPGKAPLAVVEKNADPNALANDFLEHAINGLYKKAVETEELRPIGEPNVKVTKFVPFSTLEFEVEAEVIGKIVLPDYKKISVPRQEVKVSQSEVSDVLKSLQQRQAERLETSKPVASGDEVTIDFSATDDKKQPIAGATGNDYPLIIGSSQFIPGFEDKLIGAKSGQDVDFGINFPQDYGVASLAGKRANFKVKVKKVCQLKKPKLDDDFARSAGPFQTMTQLKKDIKNHLESERKTAAERAFKNDLVLKISEKSQLDIPPSLIDEQVLVMEEEEKRNLTYKGVTWQQHLKDEGIDEEQHRQRHRPDAEKRVKGGLVLSEIATREGIEASEKEVDKQMDALKKQYQDQAMQSELDGPKARDEVASRLITEKTIAKLVTFASGG